MAWPGLDILRFNRRDELSSEFCADLAKMKLQDHRQATGQAVEAVDDAAQLPGCI